jgi:ribose transport system ATP-binding protein
MPARLTVQAVSKSFGATRALCGVDLEAQAGQIHAVIGENGAGKSTLMRVLSGEIAADQGRILIDGQPLKASSPAAARSQGISIVSQEVAVCPHMTVLDNIMLGQEPTRLGMLDGKSMRREASRAISMLLGCGNDAWLGLDVSVGALPMAGRQLVEIARALVGRGGCRVLILDEPTSSLGREDAARLFAVLRKLCEDGATILYVSHFLEEVSAIAQSYTVLRDGSTVGTGRMAETTLGQIVEKMAGRRIEQWFVRSARTVGPVVLQVDALAGHSKPTRASLQLRRGEVLGIAGLLGAGRTELLEVIFGLASVRSGTIRVGAFVGPASPTRRLAQGVGMLSEDRKGQGLATSLSIADNLTLSKLPTAGFLRLLSPRRQRQITQDWIERLGIKATDPWQPVADLSGGNQQKVAIGRLLHHGVDVLLLDEPTRGIDVASKAQIYEIIDRLACEGKAVLMVSSYLPELLGMCDRIQVMRRGELGESRSIEACTSQSLLEEATGASG